MNDLKISMIIPCYNVENYLRECLDSLTKQDIQYNYELICVNDGSTDNTLAILEEYAAHYPYIRVISQPNAGLSAARNTGIQLAAGEYICFLDSDDFVKEDYLSKMYAKAKEDDADITVCGIRYYFKDDEARSYDVSGLNDKYPELAGPKRGIISSLFAWNKLFKRSFFEEMGQRFVIGTWYEDIEVTTYLFAKAKTVSFVDETLIFYRQREASIMATLSKRCEELFAVLDRTYQKFEEADLLNEYYDELCYLFIEQLLIYGQFRFLAMDNYQELVTRCIKQVKGYFPDYLNNHYFKDQSRKYQLLVRFNNALTAPLFRKYLLRKH